MKIRQRTRRTLAAVAAAIVLLTNTALGQDTTNSSPTTSEEVADHKLSLSYGRFELYNECGYVFDLGDSPGNFFYIWSELTYSLADWLRVGLVATRSNAYQTDLDIERGFSAGFSYKSLDFTTYVFN